MVFSVVKCSVQCGVQCGVVGVMLSSGRMCCRELISIK